MDNQLFNQNVNFQQNCGSYPTQQVQINDSKTQDSLNFTMTQKFNKLGEELSQKLIRLSEIRDALINKGRITEEEYPSVRYLFREIIGFKEFNPLVRDELIKFIFYSTYNKSDAIITPNQNDNNSVDMYVIVQGSVRLSAFPPEEQQRENCDILSQFDCKQLGPGEIFGDFSAFQSDKQWKSFSAYSESENLQLISISSMQVKEFLTKLNKQQKHDEIIAFLSESVPGFKSRTTALKERLSKFFTIKIFNPGHKLIVEGKKSEYAYIVLRGELKMVSEQIPIIINNLDKIKRARQRTVVNNHGYFSHTLNSFQIGIISTKQWAGDEILVLRDDPFPYSVIATTIVEVLAISKSDILQRVSKDIREMMEQKVQMKLEWVKKRLIEVCLGVENIALWDNLQQDFIDKVNVCTKKFPATNFGAFVKIVNQTVLPKPEIQKVVSETLQNQEEVQQQTAVNEKPSKGIDDKQTINLKPSDYCGSKSARSISRRSASEVYNGGLFNSTIDFKQMIDEQLIRQSLPIPLPQPEENCPLSSRFSKTQSTLNNRASTPLVSFRGKKSGIQHLVEDINQDINKNNSFKRPDTAISFQNKRVMSQIILSAPQTNLQFFNHQRASSGVELQSIVSVQNLIQIKQRLEQVGSQTDRPQTSSSISRVKSVKKLAEQSKLLKDMNKIPLNNAFTFNRPQSSYWCDQTTNSQSISQTYSVPTIPKSALTQRKTQLLLALKQTLKNPNSSLNYSEKDLLIRKEVAEANNLFTVCGRQIKALPPQNNDMKHLYTGLNIDVQDRPLNLTARSKRMKIQKQETPSIVNIEYALGSKATNTKEATQIAVHRSESFKQSVKRRMSVSFKKISKNRDESLKDQMTLFQD